MKKKEITIMATDPPEFVNVKATETFHWKFDTMYYFDAGNTYTIPNALYCQIKQYMKLELTKEQPTKETKEKTEEINDGNTTE
jgi:hypothetical protein